MIFLVYFTWNINFAAVHRVQGFRFITSMYLLEYVFSTITELATSVQAS